MRRLTILNPVLGHDIVIKCQHIWLSDWSSFGSRVCTAPRSKQRAIFTQLARELRRLETFRCAKLYLTVTFSHLFKKSDLFTILAHSRSWFISLTQFASTAHRMEELPAEDWEDIKLSDILPTELWLQILRLLIPGKTHLHIERSSPKHKTLSSTKCPSNEHETFIRSICRFSQTCKEAYVKKI